LAATIDIFGRWQQQFGEDGTLLALLAAQVLEEAAGQGDSLGAGGKATAAGCVWRVGIHLPVKSDNDIVKHAAAMADGHEGSQVREPRVNESWCLNAMLCNECYQWAALCRI
jgi:hypothetical protein